MLKLTRLYKKGKSTTVNSQAFFLLPDSVESIRPSTTLGTGHKTTIRTKSGMEVPVKETKEAVLEMMKPAPEAAPARAAQTVRRGF